MLKSLLFLFAFAASLNASCIAVDRDRILGRDLVGVDAAFSALGPDVYFSYAPAVGKQRVISPGELSSWAASHGLNFKASAPVCFERAAYTLTAAEVAAKIHETFSEMYPSVKVEVIEVCKCTVPPGTLEFPLAGAAAPPLGHSETPVLWRGQLVSKSGMPYPIWARVRVLAEMTLVRARENIRAQQIVEAPQIETVNVTESPLRFAGKQSAAIYVGKLAARSLPEGSYLDPKSVRLPPAVVRGEIVKVDVMDGATRLRLDARAETSGNIGDKITLINPSGLRRFQATVTSPGNAHIELSPTGEGNRTTAENKDALLATTSKGTL